MTSWKKRDKLPDKIPEDFKKYSREVFRKACGEEL